MALCSRLGPFAHAVAAGFRSRALLLHGTAAAFTFTRVAAHLFAADARVLF
jgi:hypothetical protein